MKDTNLQEVPNKGKIGNETAFRDGLTNDLSSIGQACDRLNNDLADREGYKLPCDRYSKMEKILDKKVSIKSNSVLTNKKFVWTVLILLMLIIAMIVGVVTVSSVRENAVDTLIKMSGKYGEILYLSNDTLVCNNVQAPTFLPNNFGFASISTDGSDGVINDDDTVIIQYTDPDFNILTFKRHSLENSGGVENTEITDDKATTVQKEVVINRCGGSITQTDNELILKWRTEKFEFSLSTNLLDMDLVPIAESVSIQ